jgi:hypothetical protein
MSYHPTIQSEARRVDNLGPNAPEDQLRALYFAILSSWFPVSRGYLIGRQSLIPQGKPEFIVVRPTGDFRNPVFVMKLKRPSKWGETGRDEVMHQLTQYIKDRFDFTRYETIYGLAGIGLHWMVCRVQKSGERQHSLVLDWQDNVASDASYASFRAIADHVHNIV